MLHESRPSEWEAVPGDRRRRTAGATPRPRVLAPDRHHRLHDGLRHHGCGAGLLPGEVQEARRWRQRCRSSISHGSAGAPVKLGLRRGDRSRRSSSSSASERARHRRSGSAPGALRGLRLRGRRAGDLRRSAMSRMMAAVAAVHLGRDLEDGQPPASRPRWTEIADVYTAGVEAGAEGAGRLSRQRARWGSRCRLRWHLERRESGSGRGQQCSCSRRRACGRGEPPGSPSAAEVAAERDDHLVRGRRRRGLHDRRSPTPTTASVRSSSSSSKQGSTLAGDDGCVLDRHLGRPCSTACRWRRSSPSSPICASTRPA